MDTKEPLGTHLHGIELSTANLVNVITDLAATVVEGNLTARGDVEQFEGDSKRIVQSFNDMLDAVSRPLTTTAEYIECIAQGSLPRKIIDDYKGDFNTIKNHLNSLIDKLRELTNIACTIAQGDISVQVNRRSEKDILAIAFQQIIGVIGQLVEEIQIVNKATAEGKLESRGNVTRFQGAFASIVRGVNTMLDTVIEPLNVAAEYLDRIASGNIPAKITDEYKGDFDGVKKTLNVLIDKTNEVIRIARKIADGDLNVKAEKRSDKDDLMGSMENMLMYLQDVSNIIKKISNKDGTVTITPRSDRDIFSHALHRMVNNLRAIQASYEELESQTHALRKSEQQLQQQRAELQRMNAGLVHQTQELEKQKVATQTKNFTLEKVQRFVEEKVRELELSSKYQAELLLVIDEVLGLSRMELGKMGLHLAEMSLRELANYIGQHFTAMAKRKGLSLKVTLAKELPVAIRTDRQRVEQIVKSFLSNAFRFTEQGGVNVRIARPSAEADLSRSGLTPQDAVAISISDTGIGIPVEKQRLMRDALQQAESASDQGHTGIGFGLWISWELATLLGGEIQFHSEEDKGSTFTLYLPEYLPIASKGREVRDRQVEGYESQETRGTRRERPSPHPSRRSLPLVSSTEREEIQDDRLDTSPGSKSLLMIEDDPTLSKILVDLARERGFKGLITTNGVEGWQLAVQYLPSAITLDSRLLDLDGWTVMKQLKANPDTRHIPVHVIFTPDKSRDDTKIGDIGYSIELVTSAEALNQAFKKIEARAENPIKYLLIVEDNEVIRASMVELLSSDEVEISTAAKGKEAYQLLQTTSFDCMVLDLALPDISGFEFLKMIRDNATIIPFPIIIYTRQELTEKEQEFLRKYAERPTDSKDRLLNEVTLFLQQVESKLSPDQQQNGWLLHKKDVALNGKNILVVDDDIRDVYALTTVVEHAGLNILLAENGKEALKQLKTNPSINLVLIDTVMPEMDGYEATQAIRKQPQFRKLPIIAMTTETMKDDGQKCLEAGANDYLPKPIEPDKLLSLLRVWLY
jgi:CheY-like chemotaxis protein/signal transduction histidine kinase